MKSLLEDVSTVQFQAVLPDFWITTYEHHTIQLSFRARSKEHRIRKSWLSNRLNGDHLIHWPISLTCHQFVLDSSLAISSLQVCGKSVLAMCRCSRKVESCRCCNARGNNFVHLSLLPNRYGAHFVVCNAGGGIFYHQVYTCLRAKDPSDNMIIMLPSTRPRPNPSAPRSLLVHNCDS